MIYELFKELYCINKYIILINIENTKYIQGISLFLDVKEMQII